MKTQTAIAKRLNKLLIQKHMTQYRLSKNMITSQSTIKNIMHEQYKSINFDTLIKIADALDMTVQEFLDDPVFDRENLDVD